ncbi:dihydropteroate synthase [Auraticoccus sp. F435]|uniref:Dihydropteroate synthase n=1 Tax=Auraticoccus cholistanensis TaxID=2656650 RepID=A0A6A9UVW5_9ACTN|nr:dihydropteroate synthase [Auraticoccus cholistanensis]MVA76983.1 dihydropteroate synthase [Auraticoccus cholistanensis]
MGVLNVTPDSFSDGGRWLQHDRAVEHGLRLWAEGAALVDVGGESTRPGAPRVAAPTELGRVLPVVRDLVAAGVAVSVDTMRASVAQACVEVGAVVVNDVSGGLADPAMLRCVADAGVDYVAMHWRAHSARMADLARYDDVVADVRRELEQRVEAALAAGVRPERLVLDPGIGFAKTAEHNWALLAAVGTLTGLGHRLLVGVSRKRFLGALLADPVTGEPRPTGERDAAALALTTVLAERGVWAVRTHTVRPHVDALRVLSRLAAEGAGGPVDGSSG